MKSHEPPPDGAGFLSLELAPAAASHAADGDFFNIDQHLAEVISSARDVAAAAEELLRELALQEAAARAGHPAASPKAIALAPRLLSATQQQLVSVMAMLRTM